jgi:hypothetical protein
VIKLLNSAGYFSDLEKWWVVNVVVYIIQPGG